MNTITFIEGVEVKFSDNLNVAADPMQARGFDTGKGRRIPTIVDMPTDKENAEQDDPILAALKRADMDLVRTVTLTPKAPMGAEKRGAVSSSAELNVDIDHDEDAVLLIEQEGMYVWKYPDGVQSSEAGQKRRIPTENAKAQRTFTIELDTVASSDTTTRNIFGKIKELALDAIKVYVLRFVARTGVELALDYLEKDIAPQLIKLKSAEPDTWKQLGSVSDLDLPTDRTPRVLLFVHGTFSSTISAFGALGATPWGISLLDACFENYDAVIGFDHLTLKEDPLKNARQLLDLLSVHTGKQMRVDIITHSRGSLVVRSLVEKLLPAVAQPPFSVNRIIFAGATNDGTLLARPDNWKQMIDLYTNLVAGTSRVIGMISPQTKVVAAIFSEVIKNLGSFVKYCTVAAISDGLIPGLAAMEPGGSFIADINGLQTGQPTVDNSYYCIITSDFQPSLFGDQQPKELPKRFLELMAGDFMKQLMKEANDLVVNTSSMGRIDVSTGDFVKEKYEFGVNAQVYHTNYFTRPEVSDALARWLQLPPAKKKGATRGAAGINQVQLPELPAMPVTQQIAASVDKDILLFDTAQPVHVLGQKIAELAPSYVVLQRNMGGSMLNYAFKSEEALQVMSDQVTGSIQDAFQLHEGNSSGEESISGDLLKEINPTGNVASEVRKVVLDGGMPVGVVKETSLPDAEELAALASVIEKPADVGDQILRRRTMPSFAAAAERPADAGEPEQVQGTAPEDATPQSPPLFHVYAEMNAQLAGEADTDLVVTISREVIEKALSDTSASGTIAVADETKKVIVTVIPKKNLQIADDSGGRAEIDLPGKEATELYFTLRPSGMGKGEVWIIIRQGQVPLLKLILMPEIVAATEKASGRITATASGAAQLPDKPLHQLWIEESQTSEGMVYKYTVYSEGLKIKLTDVSRPIKGNREDYVNGLYQRIEDRWTNSKEDKENFQEELRAFGTDLLEELIPDKLKQLLWDRRADFDSIQVVSSEPFVPWELVHLKDPGKRGMPDEVKFLGQMGLVRWLEGAGKNGWPPQEIKMRDGKVKYVIPDYPHPDYKLPEAQKEKDYLVARFNATPVEPTSGAVRNVVSKPGGFDLLHFACHGVADMDHINDAALLMEGKVQGNKYITDQLTAGVVKNFSNLAADDNTPMIVLNACQAGRMGYKLTGIGGFADAFLSAGAGAFIGTLWSVGDSPARTFTGQLYESLDDGKTLAEAATAAREAARAAQEATWLAYVVYGHPHMKLVRG